ncbi:MAG: glycosyltransferase family 4 protein [Leptolyngbyaceae bacterium]|nr:glycosyltransferase family 4 protein [Leptolyngbyaceae bacterium]
MRILMISSTFPYPPSRGGTEIRTFNLLKYLNQFHDVTLVTQRHADVSDEDMQQLASYVRQLKIFDLAKDARSHGGPLGKIGRFVSATASGTPPNVLHRYSPDMQQWIDTQVETGAVDIITCEHSVNAVYIRPSYKKSVRTILNIHSLIYNWMLNHLHMNASDYALRDRLYLSTVKRYEKRYQQQFSHGVVTTSDDQDELIKLCPHLESTIVANGVDLNLFPLRSRDPGGLELVFVGAMNSSHNIDAAKFFVNSVMPLLREKYPSIHFTIVGASPTPAVEALAKQEGVTVTGKVASITDYLHRAVIAVVPLRAGFGIKNKTLEAMAAGVPVVASDRGLEGLEVDSSTVPLRALRANEPQEYVAAIRHLLDDPDLRASLSINGRSLVEHTFSWDKAGRDYESVLTQTAKYQKMP